MLTQRDITPEERARVSRRVRGGSWHRAAVTVIAPDGLLDHALVPGAIIAIDTPHARTLLAVSVTGTLVELVDIPSQ